MGAFFTCMTEEAELKTPVGSCACGRLFCSCFGSKASECKTAEILLAEKVNEVLKVQIVGVEEIMREVMTQNLEKFGVIPPVHILEKGAQSPMPHLRALTIRVNKPETPIADETPQYKLSVEPVDI